MLSNDAVIRAMHNSILFWVLFYDAFFLPFPHVTTSEQRLYVESPGRSGYKDVQIHGDFLVQFVTTLYVYKHILIDLHKSELLSGEWRVLSW